MSNSKNVTAGALLLALGIIFQSLRIILPVPMLISMFLIGALVNLILIVAAVKYNLSIACLIALILPNIAYLQGQIVLPILIPVVAIGNLIYAWSAYKFQAQKRLFLLIPFFKASFMYLASYFLLRQLQISSELSKVIGFSMGIAQIITGMLGIVLWQLVNKKIKF